MTIYHRWCAAQCSPTYIVDDQCGYCGGPTIPIPAEAIARTHAAHLRWRGDLAYCCDIAVKETK